MRIGLILFARLDSRRLPGKALLPIGRRPLIGLVLDRVRRVTGANRIVLATTDRAEDDALKKFAENEGIACFRGALDDVAGRALACARAHELDHFVRICGDRPFLDPALTERAMSAHATARPDLTTTQSARPYPPGLTTEVISVAALERACGLTRNREDREHLTRYFYRRAQHFAVHAIHAPATADFSGVRLVVDDAVDLDRARHIVGQLNDPAGADAETIVTLARTWDRENFGAGAAVRRSLEQRG